MTVSYLVCLAGSIINRGDSFRRRRSRSNSIQPPTDLPLQQQQQQQQPSPQQQQQQQQQTPAVNSSRTPSADGPTASAAQTPDTEDQATVSTPHTRYMVHPINCAVNNTKLTG